MQDLVSRRQVLAAASVVVLAAQVPSHGMAADEKQNNGIVASVESLSLVQEAVKSGGQLRAEATIRNTTSGYKAGLVLTECRNPDGVVVDQNELQLQLDAGEAVTLRFTSDVGTVKGVAFFEIKTGTSAKEAPFEIT